MVLKLILGKLNVKMWTDLDVFVTRRVVGSIKHENESYGSIKQGTS